MDPETKQLNFIFPTNYVIPNSLKFSHWPSKLMGLQTTIFYAGSSPTGMTWTFLLASLGISS